MGLAECKRHSWVVIVGVLLGLFLLVPGLVSAQIDEDFPVAGGRFFTQTGGGGGMGYAITDTDDIAFWSGFQRLGGVDALGYPVSRRFTYKGFVNQAFQKAILQWDGSSESVNFLNIFDELSAAGADAQLATLQVPANADWSGDVGLAWGDVVQRHLDVLDQNAAIKTLFMANPEWLNHYGLPMGYQDFGTVRVLRAQRATFQQWMEEVPWAAAGQVVVANGGDIAKQLGLFSATAGSPHLSSETPAVVPEGPTAAPGGGGPDATVTATPTPAPTTVPTTAKPVAVIDDPLNAVSFESTATFSFSGHGETSDGSAITEYRWGYGMAPNWTHLSSDAAGSVTNLPQGTWTLMFQVMDGQGVWSDEVHRTITVLPSWHEVKRFTGSSDRNTETFAITSSQWRIRWVHTATYWIDLFILSLYRFPNDYQGIVAWESDGSASDTSYFYSRGTFWLDISVVSSSYDITVEELR